MRITKDFCELPRFLQVNAGLTCREKCHGCKRKWAATGTQAVSRGVGLEKINGRMVEMVYYLCATCADAIQSKEIVNITSECK